MWAAFCRVGWSVLQQLSLGVYSEIQPVPSLHYFLWLLLGWYPASCCWWTDSHILPTAQETGKAYWGEGEEGRRAVPLWFVWAEIVLALSCTLSLRVLNSLRGHRGSRVTFRLNLERALSSCFLPPASHSQCAAVLSPLIFPALVLAVPI